MKTNAMVVAQSRTTRLFNLFFDTNIEDISSAGNEVRTAERKDVADIVTPVCVERFETACRIKEAEVDGRHLTMRLYMGSNARIERIVRIPCERKMFMRSSMAYERRAISPYTPREARASGLPFTLEGCLKWTQSVGLKDIALQQLKESDPEVVSRLLEDQDLLDKQRRAALAALSKSIPVPEPEPENPDRETGKILSHVIGLVTAAGDKRICPPDAKAYWTFVVQVQDSRGENHEFIGKDLKEKFQQRAFTVGDRIDITKRQAKFAIGDEKSSKSRFKNFYTVQVVERCSL
jgi:hypothetical protein